MGIILEYCPIFQFYPPPNIEQHQIPLVSVQSNSQRSVITFYDFQIEGKLGEGGFGSVFLGQLKSNVQKGIIQKFAIKMVSKKKLKQHNIVQNAINQKVIAILIMSFQDQWYIYFVLEYAQGGDTYGLIKKSSPKFLEYKSCGEPAVKFIAACVILGLQQVHKNDYIYRDLKPENVMVFQDGYVKISDFGLAKKAIEGSHNKTILGTRFYFAPEMLLRKGYDKKVDLWALGVYLYQMSSFSLPFLTEDITPQRFQSVCRQAQQNRIWKNQNISAQLKDLIHNLLRFDPKNRIGAQGWNQIKSHTFFKDFDWTAIQQGKMQSPIKQIIRNHPTPIKQYQPPEESHSRQRPRIQGWSYYGKYAHQ